jgi:hypothetical protein
LDLAISTFENLYDAFAAPNPSRRLAMYTITTMRD